VGTGNLADEAGQDTVVARLGLRRATAEDRDLLFRIYTTSRDDVAQASWDEDAKEAFLWVQYLARELDYRRRRPHAEHLLITIDGQDVGRLSRTWLPGDELRLLDIAVLPEWRGRGIGTALIVELVEEASQDGLLLSLHVELDNPARRLYERLGFVVAAQNEVYARLELRPG
jgi:ribosomal protein S18 acetylase RimI-like enzyme